MRPRIVLLKVNGETVVAKRSNKPDWFGKFHTGVVVCSESPKHATNSIKKVAAYHRRLLDAPMHVKMNYTASERQRLRKIFTRLADYKVAIGML